MDGGLAGEREIAGHRRPIRSYALREGRLTDAQRRAYATLWPGYGVAAPGADRLDLDPLFGPGRPIEAEIGFGNGENLAALAAAHPEVGFLGIEVHRPGIGRLLQRMERDGLANIRLIQADAAEVLAQWLPDACLRALHVLFPDPWPKTRHRKRRLIQPQFLDQIARVLVPGGRFFFATDWAEYARQTLALLDAHGAFHNEAGPGTFSPRPADRSPTHFERRGQRLGHPVWDLVYGRNPVTDPARSP